MLKYIYVFFKYMHKTGAQLPNASTTLN